MTSHACLAVSLFLLLSFSLLTGSAQPRVPGIDSFRYPEDLKDEQHFEDYTVRIYRDEIGIGGVEILKRGERIWSGSGGTVYRIGQIETGEALGTDVRLVGNKSGAYVLETINRASADVTPGADVTGDGSPNLVISKWTGGASCCANYYVFDLGAKFQLLAKLEGHEGPCGFIDLDGDAVPEFVTIDTSNPIWRYECHACQPRPRVVLRYRKGSYALAPDLMRRPPPDMDEVNAMAQRICDHRKAAPKQWDLDTEGEFGGYFSALLYTGNPKVARLYLHRAYCGDESAIARFLKAYSENLKKTKYWPELSQLTGDLIQ